jgi:opacity protein-like surface antigen
MPLRSKNVFAVNRSIQNTFTLSALCLSIAAAHAADDPAGKGLYVGASLGRGSFGAKDLGLPKVSSDEVSRAGKLYAGYRLTDTWGVEAGLARLGSVKETLAVGSNSVTQSASGRSLYVAGTGRMPLSSSFALNAKAGLAFGKVSGTNVLPPASDMTGSKRSFMYGVGVEYRLSQNVALTADFDHFGKLSGRVNGNMLSAGLRYGF